MSEFDKLIEKIQLEYNKEKDRADRFVKKYNEYSKDEEVERLNAKINDLYKRSLLLMSEKEDLDEKEFRKEHYQRHNCSKSKFSGNTYIYTLTGTGVGTIINIKCPICGESKDITDISSW